MFQQVFGLGDWLGTPALQVEGNALEVPTVPGHDRIGRAGRLGQPLHQDLLQLAVLVIGGLAGQQCRRQYAIGQGSAELSGGSCRLAWAVPLAMTQVVQEGQQGIGQVYLETDALRPAGRGRGSAVS